MIQAPKLLNKVQPIYPEAAKAAGVQGSVILRAVIGIEGNPLSLRVMNSQVDPELARAAVEAVSKWRYSPTLLNGEPIEVDTTITVKFTLSSSSIGMPTRKGQENPQESVATSPSEEVCLSEVLIPVRSAFWPWSNQQG